MHGLEGPPASASGSVKKCVQGVLTALLIIGITLGAMFALVRATLGIAQIESPILRAVAVAAELVLGVVLLVGTIYLATHLAVHIFGPRASGT